MASIRFEHINKSFGKVVVMQDLNLTITDHEFVVLVRPSGSGKSTILRMVAGLEEPTGGNLYIGDRRVNGVAPKDRDIAMVFQSYALYPQMNVSDNMAYGLERHHVPKKEREEKVQEAARMRSNREATCHLLVADFPRHSHYTKRCYMQSRELYEVRLFSVLPSHHVVKSLI